MGGKEASYCKTWEEDPGQESSSKVVKAGKWPGPCPRRMRPPPPASESSEEVQGLQKIPVAHSGPPQRIKAPWPTLEAPPSACREPQPPWKRDSEDNRLASHPTKAGRRQPPYICHNQWLCDMSNSKAPALKRWKVHSLVYTPKH